MLKINTVYFLFGTPIQFKSIKKKFCNGRTSYKFILKKPVKLPNGNVTNFLTTDVILNLIINRQLIKIGDSII